MHHGYLGLGVGLAALLLPVPAPFRAWTFWIGIALVASDLIHHFLVLWPLTGSPEFHIVYPDSGKEPFACRRGRPAPPEGDRMAGPCPAPCNSPSRASRSRPWRSARGSS